MFLDVDECILQHLLEKGHLLRVVHIGQTCKALHARARDYLNSAATWKDRSARELRFCWLVRTPLLKQPYVCSPMFLFQGYRWRLIFFRSSSSLHMIACDSHLFHNFSIPLCMTLAWSDLRGGGVAETCIHQFKRSSSTRFMNNIMFPQDPQACSFDGTVLFTATMEIVDAQPLIQAELQHEAAKAFGYHHIRIAAEHTMIFVFINDTNVMTKGSTFFIPEEHFKKLYKTWRMDNNWKPQTWSTDHWKAPFEDAGLTMTVTPETRQYHGSPITGRFIMGIDASHPERA